MTIHFSDVPATFRNIPRTGTTSFKFWVRENIRVKEILNDDAHSNMLKHLTLDEIKERWPNYGTTFGFVRNPYDRLVSIFHFVGQDAKKRIMKRRNHVELDILRNIPIEVDLKILFQYQKGFDNWIKNTRQDSDIFMLQLLNNKNTETQMHFFNHVVPDIVVHLENYSAEFTQIQDLLNCNAPPIHTNSSVHKEYRNYFTDETRAIATKWLEEDLDTFKYTF